MRRRTRVAALLTLGLLAAACGNGDSGIDGLGQVTTTAGLPGSSTTETSGASTTRSTIDPTSTVAETTTSAPGDTTTSTGAGTTVTTGPPPGTTATAASTTKAPVPPTSPPTTARPPATPPPTSAGPANVQVKLTTVATMDKPIVLVARPGSTDLYVGEKGGRVRRLRDNLVVLDLAGQVSTGGEQGLLGLAFSPEGDRLYVSITDTAGDSRLLEYGINPGTGEAINRRDVLVQDQPFANHNGGHIVFGPDGYLYYALGDGGSGGDPQDNAEDLGTLLGKILRFDPRRNGAQAYTVPADNPFVVTGGARSEIWSYGLRNPWRFSFDRSSGDLWIADVGQNQWEEISHSPAPGRGRGVDYGWDSYEGTHRFGGEPDRAGTVKPVFEYSHANGCSITGGFVYRGSAIPALRGAYLYSDYCSGGVRLITVSGTTVTLSRNLGLSIPTVTSFGQDANGELYVLSAGGTVARIDPA